jgi:methylglyoxal reductase
MQYRPLGRSGIEASVIGLGTSALGGWMWGEMDERESEDAIRAALDAGITLVDMAPIYNFGRAEEIVGRTLAGRRDEIVLATKCGLRWDQDQGELHYYFDGKGLSADQTPGSRPIYKNLAPGSIRHELEQSLRRLKTDRIDLYQTHVPAAHTPIEETMATLLALKDEGKIRAIGVSNVNLDQVKGYAGQGGLDAVQNRFSRLDREDAGAILPFCRARQVAYLAYSPMAMGLLSGKIGPERRFDEGDRRRGQARFSVENRERVGRLLEELRPIAEAHALTFAQLAAAWAFHQPGVTHALLGARNPRQAQENARAGDVRLTADELKAIDEAIGRHPEIV